MLPIVRRGRLDDIAELLRLREVMFRELGEDLSRDEWRESTRVALERGLREGDLVAVVVEGNGGLWASGILQIIPRLGSPRFPKGTYGYVGSIVVDEAQRRRGLGAMIVEALIDEARQRGLERIELHASDKGESIYRMKGFIDRGGGREMRLDLGR